MSAYTDLFRQRSDLKTRMRLMRHDRTKWAEYALLGEKVKEMTKELKRQTNDKDNSKRDKV